MRKGLPDEVFDGLLVPLLFDHVNGAKQFQREQELKAEHVQRKKNRAQEEVEETEEEKEREEWMKKLANWIKQYVDKEMNTNNGIEGIVPHLEGKYPTFITLGPLKNKKQY